MKPNYDEMSRQELRVYILEHRDDLDALRAFYDRRSPDSEAVWYSPPKTLEEWKQQEELLRPIFEADREKERQRKNNSQAS